MLCVPADSHIIVGSNLSCFNALATFSKSGPHSLVSKVTCLFSPPFLSIFHFTKMAMKMFHPFIS